MIEAGRRFGRLVVQALDYVDKSGNKYWRTQCDCGNTQATYGGHLTQGRSRSCGCARKLPRGVPPAAPNGAAWISLGRGKFALIDEADRAPLSKFTWHCDSEGYAQGTVAGVHVRMHNFLLGRGVDHRDGNRLNNQRSNLRRATSMQQNQNRPVRRGTRSGFKGVGFYAPGGTWRARIGVAGKTIWCRYFKTPEEAARAYDDAARQHFGEFARLNFPRAGEMPARVETTC